MKKIKTSIDSCASVAYLNLMECKERLDQIDEAWILLDKAVDELTLGMRAKTLKEIPPSVHEFFKCSGMEGFSISFGENNIITNTIAAIKRAIDWLIEITVNLFRLIFDNFYRAQRKFMKHQQIIFGIVEQSKKQAIESSNCNAITFDIAFDMMKKIIAMNKEIQSASAVSTAQHLNRFIVTATTEFGCQYIEGNLVDRGLHVKEVSTGTLFNLGWNFDNIREMVSGFIVMTRENTTSKVTEKNTLSMISELKKRVNVAISKNEDSSTVIHLQEQLADKKRIHTFVKNSLEIMMHRFLWLEEQYDIVIKIVKQYK